MADTEYETGAESMPPVVLTIILAGQPSTVGVASTKTVYVQLLVLYEQVTLVPSFDEAKTDPDAGTHVGTADEQELE